MAGAFPDNRDRHCTNPRGINVKFVRMCAYVRGRCVDSARDRPIDIRYKDDSESSLLCSDKCHVCVVVVVVVRLVSLVSCRWCLSVRWCRSVLSCEFRTASRCWGGQRIWRVVRVRVRDSCVQQHQSSICEYFAPLLWRIAQSKRSETIDVRCQSVRALIKCLRFFVSSLSAVVDGLFDAELFTSTYDHLLIGYNCACVCFNRSRDTTVSVLCAIS